MYSAAWVVIKILLSIDMHRFAVYYWRRIPVYHMPAPYLSCTLECMALPWTLWISNLWYWHPGASQRRYFLNCWDKASFQIFVLTPLKWSDLSQITAKIFKICWNMFINWYRSGTKNMCSRFLVFHNKIHCSMIVNKQSHIHYGSKCSILVSN